MRVKHDMSIFEQFVSATEHKYITGNLYTDSSWKTSRLDRSLYLGMLFAAKKKEIHSKGKSA
jgi:hypothetical protein